MKNIYQCKVCSETFSLLRYLRKHVTTPAVGDDQPNKCQSFYSKAINFQENLQVSHKIVTENTPTAELNVRTTRQRPQLISTNNQRKTEISNEDDCTNIEDELACLKFEPDEEDKIYFFDGETQVLPCNDTFIKSPQTTVKNEDRKKKDNHETIFLDDEALDKTQIKKSIFKLQKSQTREIGNVLVVSTTKEVTLPAKPTICKKCNLACTSLEHLCIHYETLRKLPVVSLARVTTNQINLECKQHKKNCYACNICGQKFSDLKTLNRHISITHNAISLKCDICQKEFKCLQNLRQHKLLAHRNMKFKCDKCPKQFIYSHNLRFHKASIHNGVRFQCDICEKQFRYRKNLKEHKSSSHNKVHYKCDLCEKQFSQVTHLRRHKASVHEGVRYQCDMCEKQFRKKSSLKEHKSISHDGIRYKCELCERQFRYRQNLKEHKASRHNGIPYKCHVCEKEFSSGRNLKLNKARSHEGIRDKYDMCEKQFRQRKKLKEQKSSQHDGVRYKCDTCPKEYLYMKHLNQHKAAIHGMRRFMCKLCSECFKTSSSLKDHQSAVHDDIISKIIYYYNQ